MKTKINISKGLKVEPKIYKVFFGEDMYTLARDPILDEEASTKGYVDNVSQHLNVENLTGNTFSSNLFCSGLDSVNSDVIRSVDNVFVYKSGSNTGDDFKSKITTTIKGVVTSTDNLTETDIPSLSWSKFVSLAPTTLSGYGITDGVPIIGDVTISSNIKMLAHPTTDNGVATIGYATLATAPDPGRVAELLFFTDINTPVGYLKCNGGILNRVTYSSLFSVISTNYNKGSVPGTDFMLPDFTSYTASTGITVYIKY